MQLNVIVGIGPAPDKYCRCGVALDDSSGDVGGVLVGWDRNGDAVKSVETGTACESSRW